LLGVRHLARWRIFYAQALRVEPNYGTSKQGLQRISHIG